MDLLLELALEREKDSHMEKFLKKHLGGGGTPSPERGEGKGPKNPTNANQGGGKGRGNLCAMNEAKPDAGTPPLFYCKPVNDKEGPCHAPDCDHRSSCMLQMKRQQHSKDGKTVTHQDHFRCTITCGYCGKRRHYEDECHIKKKESDKLKRQEQGWKRRRIYTCNVYIRALYRGNTIQYVSSGVAADWRQMHVLPQSKQTLPRINGANVRYFIEFAMNLI